MIRGRKTFRMLLPIRALVEGDSRRVKVRTTFETPKISTLLLNSRDGLGF